MEGLAADLCELANKYETILFAPFSQRVLGGGILVFMPGIELAATGKQRLELGIRTSLPKELVDSFA